MGCCHGEAARSVLAKVGGDIFSCFDTVAAEHHSRTWNSQFGLLGPVLCAATTAVLMTTPVWNILDTTSYAYRDTLNTVVSFLTVFLQVLMACVLKNFKFCNFPKVWCKLNFT
jgi:hypothetical protein